MDLGISTSKDIHHDLHDGLVHSQSSHEVWVLVKDSVAHDVSKKEIEWLQSFSGDLTVAIKVVRKVFIELNIIGAPAILLMLHLFAYPIL